MIIYFGEVIQIISLKQKPIFPEILSSITETLKPNKIKKYKKIIIFYFLNK